MLLLHFIHPSSVLGESTRRLFCKLINFCKFNLSVNRNSKFRIGRVATSKAEMKTVTGKSSNMLLSRSSASSLITSNSRLNYHGNGSMVPSHFSVQGLDRQIHLHQSHVASCSCRRRSTIANAGNVSFYCIFICYNILFCVYI